MANAVLVVKLGLGHGIVDIDGGEEQLALLVEFVEAVNTGGGLFGDTDDFLGYGVPTARVP